MNDTVTKTEATEPLATARERAARGDRLLLEARKLMRERGWSTGNLESANGQVCVLGAISLAAGLTDEGQPIYASEGFGMRGVVAARNSIKRLARALGWNPKRHGSDMTDVEEFVFGWNDASNQKAVEEAIERAAYGL